LWITVKSQSHWPAPTTPLYPQIATLPGINILALHQEQF
jgi:hypothetical protein